MGGGGRAEHRGNISGSAHRPAGARAAPSPERLARGRARPEARGGAPAPGRSPVGVPRRDRRSARALVGRGRRRRSGCGRPARRTRVLQSAHVPRLSPRRPRRRGRESGAVPPPARGSPRHAARDRPRILRLPALLERGGGTPRPRGGPVRERQRLRVPHARHGATGQLGGRGAGSAIPRRPRARRDDATAARIEGFEPSTSGSARRRDPRWTSAEPGDRGTPRGGTSGAVGPASGTVEVTIEEGACQFGVRLGRGPQERLLPGPAREPPARGRSCRGPAHARRLLLHRRLRLPCAPGGGGPARSWWTLGRGAGPAARHLALKRGGGPGRAPRGERLRRAARARERRRALRARRARPAAVHAAQGRARRRRARLQGDQSAGASPARARRASSRPSRARIT